MKNIPTVSAYRVFKNRKSILKNPLPFHNENFNNLGDIFKVRIGPAGLIVFTRSPEFIKQILQKNHKKYHVLRLLAEFPYLVQVLQSESNQEIS